MEELISRLQAGIVQFKYRKVDGSERVAFGTLNNDLIPQQPLVTNDKILEMVQEINEYGTDKVLGQVVDLVNAKMRPKPGRKKEADPSSQYYYDFVAKGLRQFKIENFIGIIE
jgi:hypothetical protein